MERNFHGISILTDGLTATALGVAGIIVLLLLGKRRAALAFGIIGGALGLAALLAPYAMAELVTRARPLAGPAAEVIKASDQAYPSGHVFGATALFGLWGFLAIHYQMKRTLLVPFLSLMVTLILAVGSGPPVFMRKPTRLAMWRQGTYWGYWCFCF